MAAAVVANVAPVMSHITAIVANVAGIFVAIAAIAANVMPQGARAPAIHAISRIRARELPLVSVDVPLVRTPVAFVKADIPPVLPDVLAILVNVALSRTAGEAVAEAPTTSKPMAANPNIPRRMICSIFMCVSLPLENPVRLLNTAGPGKLYDTRRRSPPWC